MSLHRGFIPASLLNSIRLAVQSERHFSSPLQLLGCIRPAVLTSAQILSGVPRHKRFPPASGGRPRRLLPPSGLRFISWRPIKGNADGSEGIFGNAGRVWATALRPAHLKNGLVPFLSGDGTEDKYPLLLK